MENEKEIKSILFINLKPIEKKSNGIQKKIRSQIKALSKIGYRVYFTELRFKDDNYYLEISDTSNKSQVIYRSRYKFIIYFGFYLKRGLKVHSDISTIYIRAFHFWNPIFIRTIPKNIKVIIDYPHYPYNQEYSKKISNYIRLLIDNIFSKSIHKRADKILTTSNKDLFPNRINEKVFQISNGLDYKLINHLKSLDNNIHKSEDVLIFVFVANFNFWHGLDRLLSSIVNLPPEYQEKTIFKIIGYGKIYENLKNQFTKTHEPKNIEFLNELSGKALYKVLESAHIGIDSLARHRSGNSINNSIKSKEYLGFGMKVLTSNLDSSIPERFQIKVEANESLIDLKSIIDSESKNPLKPKEIIDHALSTFNWESIYNKVKL